MNKYVTIFNEKIEEMKSDKDIEAIFITGSSKDMKFEDETKDIDIFAITLKEVDQIRDIKEIQGRMWDINIFSQKSMKQYIQKKEKFMLKALSENVILYDPKDIIKSMKLFAEQNNK